MIRRLLVVSFLLATPLAAQETVTIGTAEGAETELAIAGWDSAFEWQTFRSPVEGYLESLTFWMYGGGAEVPCDEEDLLRGGAFGCSQLAVGLLTNPYPGGVGAQGPLLYYETIGNVEQGERTIDVGGIPVTFGTDYYFGLSALTGHFLDADGFYTQGPMYEKTVADAYPDGGFDFDGTGDIRFRATFIPVPEPGTWLMVLAGILGIGLIGFERRRLVINPRS